MLKKKKEKFLCDRGQFDPDISVKNSLLFFWFFYAYL